MKAVQDRSTGGAFAPSATRRSAKLYQIQRDVPQKLYCGPHSIAAVTGLPASEVLAAARAVTGRQRVTLMWMSEVERTLRKLGHEAVVYSPRGEPTFAQWRRARSGDMRTMPLIVLITGHFVVVAGNRVVDTRFPDPIWASDFPNQRSRVKLVAKVYAP